MTPLYRDQTQHSRRTVLGFIAMSAATVAGVLPRLAAAQDDEATALLQSAAAKMGSLQSFRFKLSTINGQSTILQGLELVGVEGSVLRPQSFEATITAKVAIIEVKVRTIGIGNRLWVTDPTIAEERFIEVTGGADGDLGDTQNLADLINPDRLLLEAVKYVKDPKIEDEETIDGVETTLVTGIFDASALASLAPATPGADGEMGVDLLALGEMPILIWIDAEGYVLRIELEGPLTTAESPNVIRRLELFDFDEPVEIAEPVVTA